MGYRLSINSPPQLAKLQPLISRKLLPFQHDAVLRFPPYKQDKVLSPSINAIRTLAPLHTVP